MDDFSDTTPSEAVDTMADDLASSMLEDMGMSQEEISETITEEETVDEPKPSDTETKLTEEEAANGQEKSQTQTQTLLKPNSWRKEALEVWDQIPPAAQQEIMKREGDILAGLSAQKEDADYGRSIKEVIAPFADLIAADGVTPIQAISNMMDLHETFTRGTAREKAEAILGLMNHYKVTFNEDGSLPYEDASLAGLRREVRELRRTSAMAPAAPTQAINMEQLRKDAEKEIEVFKSDPENAFFDELVDDIKALYNSDTKPKDLRDAYNKALRNNEAVWAKELARLNAKAVKQHEEQQKAKATKAQKTTAANIKSTSKPAGKTIPGNMSIDDAISDAFREIRESSE